MPWQQSWKRSAPANGEDLLFAMSNPALRVKRIYSIGNKLLSLTSAGGIQRDALKLS